jgi:hypothetical protein
MASSTIQLQRTIARSSQYARLEPLTFAQNTYNDPAFSNADWVMQTILAPPFAWRWNRTSGGQPSTPTFVTTTGATDYKISLPTFGWLEKATAYDPNNGYSAYELQVELLKAQDTLANQPTRISTQYDDTEGNITFRLFPAPDRVYNIVIEYQNAAQLFTSITQTWEPIPDYLSFVYNVGFDYRTFEYLNDPRSQTSGQLFYQSLAQMSEGLSESEKNLWLSDKLNTIRQTQAVQSGRGY